MDLEGNETKGPCEICEFRQSKNFYSNEIDLAPYPVLVNWVDDGMGMFLVGRGFKIFDHQNKLLYKAENTVFQDLINGKFLFLEREPLPRTYSPKTGLMDLNWEFLIRVEEGWF